VNRSGHFEQADRVAGRGSIHDDQFICVSVNGVDDIDHGCELVDARRGQIYQPVKDSAIVPGIDVDA